MPGRGEVRDFSQGNTGAQQDDSGNPLKIGGKVFTSTPTVTADGKRVDAWFDGHGRLGVFSGFLPAVAGTTNGPLTFSLTTTTPTEIVASAGTLNSIFVQDVFCSNDSATKVIVELREGTTARMKGSLAASGGGFVRNLALSPWKLPANTALNAALGSAVTSVFVNVQFYVGPT